MSTYVCFDLDRECGDMERSWCDTCPKRSNSPELRGIKSAPAAPLPAAPAPTEKQDELPITRSTYGSLEACEAEQARRNAAPTEQAGELPPLPTDAAAWVSPLRYGSKVTFPKPVRPEDDEEEWYCHPLFTAEQMNTHASAALAARPAPTDAPCAACDGTGDIHDLTGEWRGECPCGAAVLRDLYAAAMREPAGPTFGAITAAIQTLQAEVAAPLPRQAAVSEAQHALSAKHESVMRLAAKAIHRRGNEGDARLADSLLGVLAHLKSAAPTVKASQ